MSIFKRVSHLIKADVHGILDHLEEPEAILKQAVREMKEQVGKREEAVQVLRQRIEQSAARSRQLQRSTLEARAQLDICLDAQNDALTRSAMRRVLELERSEKLHGQAQRSLETELQENERRLRDEQERLQGITEKMELFSTSAQSVPSSEERLFVSDEEIDIAILQARTERGKRQSSVEA